MNLHRSIGACALGLTLVAAPVLAIAPDSATASTSITANVAAAFEVTSTPSYDPTDVLTVTGTAPRDNNVWATITGTDRNASIAIDTNRSGAWTLDIPREHTINTDTITLAFHYGWEHTITQTFTADKAPTAFEVTSTPSYDPTDVLTVTGTAPRDNNVWATITGTDRNASIAIDTNRSGAWTLDIPREHTINTDTITLAFHYGWEHTITQTFTAAGSARNVTLTPTEQ